jgi:hypothetical protein
MKHICEKCINNEILKEHLISANEIGVCSYCQSDSFRIIRSDHLAKFGGDRLAKSLYYIEDATQLERELFYEGSDDLPFQELAYIIEALDIGDELFENELEDYIFQEYNFNKDLFVLNDGEHDSNIYKEKWSSFLKSTAHKHRFFNKDAKIFLDSLFEVIHDGEDIRKSVLTTLNCESSLFRARIANDENTRKQIIANPAAQLGPVPESLASEQRMTPTGISSLYCALDKETCYSEIRSITGDVVISGVFKPTEDLFFLDLTKIHTLANLSTDPFLDNFVDYSHKCAFIKDLMFLMSKPTARNNNSSYLSTQVIFEYLSIKFGSKISGLIFKSVQTGGEGTNVVLFPDHSLIIKDENYQKMIKSIRENKNENGPFKYFSYAIDADKQTSLINANANAKIKFLDGSLTISKIKSVITEAEEFNLLISHHPAD